MSKVIITDDKVDIIDNENIKIKKDGNISTLSLDILNDSIIEFEYNIKNDIKFDVFITIKENVHCQIVDKKIGLNFKVKEHYILNDNSYLIINKVNDIDSIWQYNLIDLNGFNSHVDYVLKTICKNKENYDIVVNHYNKNTESNIITNGINLKGNLIINVTGYVPKGMIDSSLMQDNRIINLGKDTSQINPVLLIDEMNVSANHSAHIGQFSLDDIFYMQSRGIDEKSTEGLLIKAFLNSKLNLTLKETIDKLIKKYWG